MKICIHRKHYVGNRIIVQDEAEATYSNVWNIEIIKTHIFGDINGEQLTIKLDHTNYKYYIMND